MRLIKCDRCGKIDDGAKLVNCGVEPFYTGRIERYSYSDVPRSDAADLCRKCNAELDILVRRFMREFGKEE